MHWSERPNCLADLCCAYVACKGLSNCLFNGHPRVFPASFIGHLFISLASLFWAPSSNGGAERLEAVVLSCSTCALLCAEHKYQKYLTIYLSIAALFLGINLYMIACLVEVRVVWCCQNMIALSPIIVFCCNMHYLEARRRKPRRRVKGVRAGFLATSTTYEIERLRQERRDRKILDTMSQRMAPAALGLSLLGFPDFVPDGSLQFLAQELHLETHTWWVHMLASQRWWHLSIALAHYVNMTWSIWIDYCREGKQDDVELIWPSFLTTLPSIERSVHAKGATFK